MPQLKFSHHSGNGKVKEHIRIVLFLAVLSFSWAILGQTNHALGTTAARLGGAQILIDVTGEGNDVLKRISVRVPLSSNTIPDYALQSMDTICKLFKVPADRSLAILDDPASNPDGACQGGISGSSGGSSYVACASPCLSADPGYYTSLQDWMSLINTSAQTLTPQQLANITGCDWNWGDGTIDHDKWCNNGDNTGHHNYPTLPPGQTQLYTITLIEYISGQPVTEFSQTYTEPIYWGCTHTASDCFQYSTTPPPTNTPCNPNDTTQAQGCIQYPWGTFPFP